MSDVVHTGASRTHTLYHYQIRSTPISVPPMHAAFFFLSLIYISNVIELNWILVSAHTDQTRAFLPLPLLDERQRAALVPPATVCNN